MRLFTTGSRWLGRALIGFVLVSMGLPRGVFAAGSDVRFQATVVSIDQSSDTEAIVTVRLRGFNVPIVVNSDTEIESHGDQVGLAGLVAGAFIKLSGFFAEEGITAEEIDILDIRDEQFRLRGQITAAGPTPGGTLITMLGVDVLVTTDTRIQRRGPSGGFTAEDLAAGMIADARGIFDTEQLVATRIKVGNRESDAPVVEFEGVVTEVTETQILVDTNGGGEAIVLLTEGTRIIGDLEVGKFVEVKGALNEDLAIVDARIKVDEDGDGDADDDDSEDVDDDIDDDDDDDADDDGATQRRSAQLVPQAEDVLLVGEVETRFQESDSGTSQELTVAFRNAGRNEEFQIYVVFGEDVEVDFGTVRANGGGRVNARYRTHGGPAATLLALLPEGQTVEDIVRVEVLNAAGDQILLLGVFE